MRIKQGFKRGSLAVAGVMVLGVLGLSGCSSMPKHNDAKVSGLNNGSDSQYGQTSSQGVNGQGQFSGQSLGGSGNSFGETTGPNGMKTTVHFGFDSYRVDSQAQTVLAPNVTYLLQNPNTNVVVAGFTDPRGSQEYNFHLGQRRANAVMNYLLQQGISQGQLCVVSYGELQPAASPDQFSGDWQKAYALDRRAVLQYNQTCGSSNSAASSANTANAASVAGSPASFMG